MMNEDVTLRKLRSNQRKAIESLLTTPNIAEAARSAGVTRNTLYRWMREDEAFKQALKQAEGEALQGLSRSLVALRDAATKSLDDAMNEDESIHVRVRAADIVIGRLLQVFDLVDLDQRVSALEARADNGKQA